MMNKNLGTPCEYRGRSPVSALTAAAHLRARGIGEGRLHALLYYSQAWTLVATGRPLFRHRIIAAADGPRVPVVATARRALFRRARIRTSPES